MTFWAKARNNGHVSISTTMLVLHTTVNNIVVFSNIATIYNIISCYVLCHLIIIYSTLLCYLTWFNITRVNNMINNDTSVIIIRYIAY